MADMFRSVDAERLFMNKTILFLGDSNIRAMYKDLVWLLQNNTLVPQYALKKKVEDSHAGDVKVKGDMLHKGRDFFEDRSYHHQKANNRFILVEYSFTSMCYSKNIISIFKDIKEGLIAPDLIVMNSTLWDINRWGPDGINLFKQNLVELMKLVSTTLPAKCLFLWVTALPVSSKIKSSLIVDDIKFLESLVRFNVLEANNFARQIVGSYGYDVLDLHYYCRMQLFNMADDGIHFSPLIMRYITNLILTHCSLSWNVQLPGNVQNRALTNTIQLAFMQDNFQTYIDVDNMLNEIEKLAPNKPRAPPLGKSGVPRSATRNTKNSFKQSQYHWRKSESHASESNYKKKSNRWFPPRPAPYHRSNRGSRRSNSRCPW